MRAYYEGGQRVLDAQGVPVKVNNNLPLEYWAQRFNNECREALPPELTYERADEILHEVSSCSAVEEVIFYLETALQKFIRRAP